MTLEEYEVAVEDAIEERELRIWEVYDLRLLVRCARRRQRVDGFDLLFLDIAGRSPHGQFTKVPKRLELFEPYVKRKQGGLF